MSDDKKRFLDAYIECALWAETDNSDDSGGRPLDENYDESDLSEETLASFKRDCEAFQEANENDLEPLDPAQAGHDFWLTRNGHGAGFWDRGLGERGERLTKASKVYGSVDLVIGDDGKIHS
jgi:hypothetical protein